MFFRDPQNSEIQLSQPSGAKIKNVNPVWFFCIHVPVTTKVEIFINLSAFIYPYTAEKAHSHQKGSRVDAMLEYGYEIVFACR